VPISMPFRCSNVGPLMDLTLCSMGGTAERDVMITSLKINEVAGGPGRC
jgi:hypothetical protein